MMAITEATVAAVMTVAAAATSVRTLVRSRANRVDVALTAKSIPARQVRAMLIEFLSVIRSSTSAL
jgi:hypothetical protein